MRKFRSLFGAAAIAALLSACGGSSSPTSAVGTSTARGSLVENPPFRIASLDAATLLASLGGTSAGAALLSITGTPACGVDFYYVKFWTIAPVAGVDQPTESSGALMVPTGAAPRCSGPRPIVLYAHGTQTDKAANIADITDASNMEGELIAAIFAAQGYIVVAPNYAGYDISTLGYHPFLNAAQQSSEMVDILAAARTALPSTLASATTDSGKLFVTGYSEGGHVAMATQRALELSGATVTAAAPMSGPYALEAFGDAIFFGSVNLGSTEFTPLLATSYQQAYGNIYSAVTDVFSATYANGIATLLPSTTPIDTIFATGLLPATAEFDSTTPIVQLPNQPAESALLTALLAEPGPTSSPDAPLFRLGFGAPYLVINDYRVGYAIDAVSDPDGALPSVVTGQPLAGAPLAPQPPAQKLRLACFMNDMRFGSWVPQAPTLLCGGDQDPTVFFGLNTDTMAAFWRTSTAARLVTVLDVDAVPAGPFAPLQTAFQTSEALLLAYYESAAGGHFSAPQAEEKVIEGYHTAVAPFCAAAARSFFSQL